MKYQITMMEIWTNTVEVEAVSREEALEKAEQMLESGDCGEFDYSFTLEPYEWIVYQEEE